MPPRPSTGSSKFYLSSKGQSESIAIHRQVNNKAVRKRKLKIQKYMWEIAVHAFFWVYFSIFSFRSTITHLILEEFTTYSPHHCFAARKCQITKSEAFKTKSYVCHIHFILRHQVNFWWAHFVLEFLDVLIL